jgi:hypothetical protein
MGWLQLLRSKQYEGKARNRTWEYLFSAEGKKYSLQFSINRTEYEFSIRCHRFRRFHFAISRAINNGTNARQLGKEAHSRKAKTTPLEDTVCLLLYDGEFIHCILCIGENEDKTYRCDRFKLIPETVRGTLLNALPDWPSIEEDSVLERLCLGDVEAGAKQRKKESRKYPMQEATH